MDCIQSDLKIFGQHLADTTFKNCCIRAQEVACIEQEFSGVAESVADRQVHRK